MAAYNQRATSRQAKADARRRQFLETAFEQFASHGYRNTSVREIARTLGVNEALLYHYFASKAELFTAALAEYAPLSPLGSVAEAPLSVPVVEVLRAQGREFLSLLQQRRRLVITMLAEAPLDPEVGEIMGAFLRSTTERMVAFLRQRQERGQFAASVPVEAAAQAYIGGLLVHFLASALFAGSAEPSALDFGLVDELVKVLMGGVDTDAGSGRQSSI